MKCIWVRSNGLWKETGVLFLLESTFQLSESLIDAKVFGFFFSQGFLFYLKIGSKFLMKKYISVAGAPAHMLENILAE